MSEVMSNCCNAPATIASTYDPVPMEPATHWYVCTKCGEPCDVSPAPSDGAEAANHER